MTAHKKIGWPRCEGWPMGNGAVHCLGCHEATEEAARLREDLAWAVALLEKVADDVDGGGLTAADMERLQALVAAHGGES